jgi:hypothetical protein
VDAYNKTLKQYRLSAQCSATVACEVRMRNCWLVRLRVAYAVLYAGLRGRVSRISETMLMHMAGELQYLDKNKTNTCTANPYRWHVYDVRGVMDMLHEEGVYELYGEPVDVVATNVGCIITHLQRVTRETTCVDERMGKLMAACQIIERDKVFV